MHRRVEMGLLALVLAVAGPGGAVAAQAGAADSGMDMSHMHNMDMQGMNNTPDADADLIAAHGKVNSIDAAAHKANITHDAIESLDWPSMTMDFKVPDDAMLKRLKAGETIDFWFVDQGPGQYVIEKIRPAGH